MFSRPFPHKFGQISNFCAGLLSGVLVFSLLAGASLPAAQGQSPSQPSQGQSSQSQSSSGQSSQGQTSQPPTGTQQNPNQQEAPPEAGGPNSDTGPYAIPKKGGEPPPPPPPEKPKKIEGMPDYSIHVDVPLVTVPVLVTTKDGQFIPNLKKENFRVYEDGTQQTVHDFKVEPAPITAVLLVEFANTGWSWLDLEVVDSLLCAVFIDAEILF